MAILFVAAILAGACTSASDGATLQSGTEPETTTTAKPTTVPTTAPTTTSTSTTETTVVETAFADMERPELEVQTEWETDLDEIFGRYLMYWEALYNAGGPPEADPDYQPLLDLLDPGVVSSVLSQVQGLAEADSVIFRPEGSLDDHGLRLPNPSVLEKTEGNRVVIQDCWIRDDVIEHLDGSDRTEYFMTVLWNVDMIVVDGEWKYFAAVEADDRSDGYQECQDLFDTLER
ncbi:MAG: hypothetical protein ACRBK7_19330 [Acidimicrobiales bacterium]